eukprot:scaffold10146_cov144-Isochrysis_galbana.AAC.5
MAACIPQEHCATTGRGWSCTTAQDPVKDPVDQPSSIQDYIAHCRTAAPLTNALTMYHSVAAVHSTKLSPKTPQPQTLRLPIPRL